MKYFALALLLSACAPEGVDWSKSGFEVALVQTENGTLKTPLKPKSEEVVDFTIQAPFTRVFEPFRKIAHRKFWTLQREAESQRRKDGHLPVSELKLKPFAGRSETYAYDVAALETQVSALAEKKSGQFRERDLESHKVINRSSSRVFGRDLSLRYLATKNGAGAFGLCLNLPGETLATDQEIMPSTARELLPPRGVHDFEVKSDIAAAEFDFARACFAVPIGKFAKSFELDSESMVSKPEAVGPVMTTEFSELAEPLKKFYALEFAKLTAGTKEPSQDELERKEKTFLDGTWPLNRRKEFLEAIGFGLRRSLDNIIHRIVVPETSAQLKTVLQDTCRRLKMSELAEYTDALDSFCRNGLEGLKIKTVALPNAASQLAGCYDGFTRVHERNEMASTCQIQLHLRIFLKDHDDRAPLTTLLESFVAQTTVWSPQIQQLRLDPLELALLLERWEKGGHSRVDDSNWREDFPALLEEIRDELAKSST